MTKIPCNVASMGRWQRYWFAEGGRLALAIVRIAVAVAVLLTLYRLADTRPLVAATVYRPVGVWMLLGHHAPPALLVTVLWVVAWASTATMLVGLASRASTALSFTSAVSLAALSFSASETWSHQYNVVFLAQCALLGGHVGDALSLDMWIRTRIRRLPALDLPRAYQWSLRLVQLAVVLMFAGAAFHKLAHGHFTLRWALSDNLRHHLLVRFDLAGLERPPLVDWLLAESWRYRTAALLNMLAQATPLVAVFLVRRPMLRALAGLMFVSETILLGVVVDLWNLHWLPLFAVFVDWDGLVAWVRRRPTVVSPASPDWRAPRSVRAFVLAFVLYDVVIAFVPTLDQRLNTFPFSSFPMFATIRVRAPYSEHLPYSVVAGSFEALSDQPIQPRVQRWLDYRNRTLFSVRDPDQLERRLQTVLARARHYWPAAGIRGLRLWLTVYEVPAYPGTPSFEAHRVAVVGEIAADGAFHTMLGQVSLGGAHPFLEVGAHGVELAPDAQLQLVHDDLPAPLSVVAPHEGHRFDLDGLSLPGNPRHFVVVSGGVPWLVASHETWHWD